VSSPLGDGLELRHSPAPNEFRIVIAELARSLRRYVAIASSPARARGCGVMAVDSNLHGPPEGCSQFTARRPEGCDEVYAIPELRKEGCPCPPGP
jgi:hypothetical protein